MLKLVFSLWVIGGLCATTTKEEAKQTTTKQEPAKPKEAPFDPLSGSTEEEIAVLLDLAKRSKAINAKEEALNQKALTLKATEALLNEKLKHFEALKQELLKKLDLLKEKEGMQKEKDNKDIGELVKVYENMKPKQAANILSQLDMGTLKEIFKRMGKKKAATVLAAMDTKKAKDLSQQLAKDE